MAAPYATLNWLSRLKLVERKCYVPDRSRHENSAEHSWQLAMALLISKDVLPPEVNVDHAIRLALMHDVCEIGVGDMPVYDPNRGKKAEEEKAYMQSLQTERPDIGEQAYALWTEYEEQQTLEAKWVKFFDRLLPFVNNINTGGRNWTDQNICRSQVLAINNFMKDLHPPTYAWICEEIEVAVGKGWLRDV